MTSRSGTLDPPSGVGCREKGLLAMATRKSRGRGKASVTRDEMIQDLARVAFANIQDFVRFEPGGGVHIYDWDKAREVGAKVSVVTRKVDRGKNAREVRVTEVKMPDKFPALMKLLKLVDPPRKS